MCVSKSTTTAPQYQYLEPRPGSNYRQMFLKGRRIRAAVVDETINGPDPCTLEEFARDFHVPLEAVQEALDYVARNRLLIEQERDREAADVRVRGPGSAPTAMRILIDENMIDRRLSARLQAAGHDVHQIHVLNHWR
jgi:uncharacterized protein (DUF433 family)